MRIKLAGLKVSTVIEVPLFNNFIVSSGPYILFHLIKETTNTMIPDIKPKGAKSRIM